LYDVLSWYLQTAVAAEEGIASIIVSAGSTPTDISYQKPGIFTSTLLAAGLVDFLGMAVVLPAGIQQVRTIPSLLSEPPFPQSLFAWVDFPHRFSASALEQPLQFTLVEVKIQQ